MPPLRAAPTYATPTASASAAAEPPPEPAAAAEGDNLAEAEISPEKMAELAETLERLKQERQAEATQEL